jgi:hypothetical protein
MQYKEFALIPKLGLSSDLGAVLNNALSPITPAATLSASLSLSENTARFVRDVTPHNILIISKLCWAGL